MVCWVSWVRVRWVWGIWGCFEGFIGDWIEFWVDGWVSRMCDWLL